MAAEHIARIGARIRQRREELGLSQRELAEALPGKSDGNQVSKWERGKHRVGDDTLDAIAEVLRCDVSYFHMPEPESGTADLMGALSTEVRLLDRLDEIDAKLERLLASSMPIDPEHLSPEQARHAAELLAPQLLAAAQALQRAQATTPTAPDGQGHPKRSSGGAGGSGRKPR